MADTGHPGASGTDGRPRFTSNVLGFAAMTLGMGALVSVDGFVKQIGNELHPVEIVFFRNFFGLVALAPLMLRRGTRLWYTRNLKLHAGRGLIHATAMLCWFWALLFVPLAEATAISFMLPIFATLGAILFLAGIWTWAGAAVIGAGAVWLIQVETKEARAKARAAGGSSTATSGER